MTPLEPPPTALLRGGSLFLDFDGTLVDLAPTPDAVEVGDDLRALLARLATALDGRMAVLSGRSIDQVEALLHPLRLAIGGSHGLERVRPGHAREAARRPDALDQAIARMRGLEAAHPGVLVEEKPLGVALHYRRAPDAEAACRAAALDAAAITGLMLQPGKMVFELKPAGSDKGAALSRFMVEPPFAGTRPVFLGDDLTDEPAFAAAQAMGGAGVLVGEARDTSAAYRLAGVAEARTWLERALA
jgi:trehalose 6-phosphate phosphatase